MTIVTKYSPNIINNDKETYRYFKFSSGNTGKKKRKTKYLPDKQKSLTQYYDTLKAIDLISIFISF